jgi:hypothetical protein
MGTRPKRLHHPVHGGVLPGSLPGPVLGPTDLIRRVAAALPDHCLQLSAEAGRAKTAFNADRSS